MREGFFGLNIATRGLYTAQRGLDIVNHNLNNVNTPGYSRQQAVQAAAKPMPIYDGTGMLGTGSDVTAINRVRDEYLDFKYWSENVSFGEWSMKSTLLEDIETTFNEPSNSGFTKILDEFFSSLQELGKDPSSSAVRALVRERGVTVAKYFNSVATHFEKLQADINDMIKTKVGEVNSIATQIQQLNRQIYSGELDGNTANDLRDQRGVLVDKLSKIINIEANEVVAGKLPSGKDDKHFVVTISGKALIDHFHMSKLSVTARKEKLNEEEDVQNLYEIGWEDGNTLEVKGGELKGCLDVRDGNEGEPVSPDYEGSMSKTPIYKGIPFYVKKMNQFVRTFAMAINEGYIDRNNSGAIEMVEDGKGHADGYGVDPDGAGPKTAVTGIRFFTRTGSNGKPEDTAAFLNGAGTIADISARYKNVTAKNFSVGADIINDYSNIAASDNPSQVGNIVNLNSLLKMRHDSQMFTEGAPEDFMKSMIATLGIDSQQAVRISANQQVIVKQVENRRLSDSGVSIDEEMTNLVKFQHAYNASAKMITTMSEVYDTLINKLGVG
ncbi:MAG: flagellar hook-associated protein FlgK [Clostridia bacterium]|nr:flagellar hook-associated protein FlgK [Clostridia bacterium]